MNTLSSTENTNDENGLLVFTKRLLAHLAVYNTTFKKALIALQKDPTIERLTPTIHESLTEYVNNASNISIEDYTRQLFALPIFSVFYQQIVEGTLNSGQFAEIGFRQLLSVAAMEKSL